MFWIFAAVLLVVCVAKPKFGIAVAALIALGLFVFMGGLMPAQPQAQPQAEPIPVAEATAYDLCGRMPLGSSDEILCMLDARAHAIK
jgi:hypothetical protein